ncbi:MAG: bifunctional oligoribonuclease/PAP phosphatase NrnA [Ruminococcaceae bacterium]|nr:bifunctional oligoribonuclease/PAP phosphatase NrnA [Oscillospiraceae bacterium]
MNREVKELILEKIKQYNRIFLFRHVRNDGDCVGATKGLKRILQLTFPQKEVYLIDENPSDYLKFLGPDDEAVCDDLYRDALGIVIDTASEARISNKNYKLCKEVIKIDHHIPLENYGDVIWVEEERSSACEMIADFYRTFSDELKIDSEAATYIYTGMVTDSGRFKYEGVTGETMRNAAVLLDAGINTEWLYANLYLDELGYLKFKAEVYNRIQITENGVAYIYIDKAMQEKFSLSLEEASACVSSLDSIRGAICWMAFIENGDAEGSIRVRLRSRFVHVNPIAEKYHGGGHACACGATVYSREEANALIKDADALLKEYKETHEGWL